MWVEDLEHAATDKQPAVAVERRLTRIEIPGRYLAGPQRERTVRPQRCAGEMPD